MRQFDVALAHELYTLIFSPAEPLLEDVTHIMAVTDGPLQSLPLSILVTEQPKGALLNYEDYREVSWLAKSYALTILPSVSSLRALRLFAKDSETAGSLCRLRRSRPGRCCGRYERDHLGFPVQPGPCCSGR